LQVLATGTRDVTGWPTIINLRADPYEKGPYESGMYIRWYADQMWLFVPIQQKIKEFFVDFDQYPYQAGSSLSASGINYQTLKAVEAMKRLKELENVAPPCPSQTLWGSAFGAVAAFQCCLHHLFELFIGSGTAHRLAVHKKRWSGVYSSVETVLQVALDFLRVFARVKTGIELRDVESQLLRVLF